MKILVTGAAGFIGYHLCESLLKNGHTVVGLDNINDYYKVKLKYDRLKELGIDPIEASKEKVLCSSSIHGEQMTFIKMNLEDRESLPQLFKEQNFEVVCNLAAQAGVRYSLENPNSYVDSNIVGFLNILECCRHNKIKHLVYASSSSVYGLNEKIPFSVQDNVDHPISLYAASKKSNELMAHTYSHLYRIPTTGLRFFTVYGPWGRPDMAIYLFTKAITDGKPINVFNNGEMERDFTYIDDIVEGVERIMEKPVDDRKELYKLYNIGNNSSVKLMDFIEAIEQSLGTIAEKNMMPMQPGDVTRTWANVDDLIADYNYRPNTPVKEGIQSFVGWYGKYYEIN
ncbi:NAD-dependent epimerase [Flagellimonas zhangzhouensis]|uniref:UDP-glucuronate 4-epimerase n=1 Tax=Flagellimonas zhangzhouensis TaxID=1073328 RepID=A0A1H2YR53_9FLAO|nr:NAD-dependent epimerase [Allomuricauda zhangzhouensis]SDR00147.1 UDP-glucuronate 4-epimerase [Allomuricauda zhangzhouensis]SDX07666.1 UDP-glucuronate 4-epimerase [Allomuricauda zhangzhouensis]